MRRILILGPCGSGKSTFARKLAAISKIPLIHLDQHYFDKGWKECPEERWIEKNHQFVSGDSWIIDGNYGGTLSMRLRKADTVIYLDTGTLTNLWRVIKRVTKYYGKQRPDMGEGCFERFDLSFLHYVMVFNFIKKRSILNRVYSIISEDSLYILKDNQERKIFFNQYSNPTN